MPDDSTLARTEADANSAICAGCGAIAQLAGLTKALLSALAVLAVVPVVSALAVALGGADFLHANSMFLVFGFLSTAAVAIHFVKSATRRICPLCGTPSLLALASPQGRQLVSDLNKDPSAVLPPTRKVSKKKTENGWAAVIDGAEGQSYDEISSATPVLSPDNRRTAYFAIRGKKWLLVVDGAESNSYDAVSGPPVFSPDSRRLAYAAKKNGNWLVVVDSVDGIPCDGILEGTPVFSFDSRRVGYGALRAGKWFVVVDNVEAKEFVHGLVNKYAIAVIVNTTMHPASGGPTNVATRPARTVGGASVLLTILFLSSLALGILGTGDNRLLGLIFALLVFAPSLAIFLVKDLRRP